MTWGSFDTGDEAQRATAVWALLDVDLEDALEPLHPGQGCCGLIGIASCARFLLPHDGGPVSEVGGEDAVVSGEVGARFGDERSESGDEVQRIQCHVGGAISEWLLQAIDHLAAVVDGKAVVGDGRARDVTAEPLELRAFVGLADGAGMEGEIRRASGVGFVGG